MLTMRILWCIIIIAAMCGIGLAMALQCTARCTLIRRRSGALGAAQVEGLSLAVGKEFEASSSRSSCCRNVALELVLNKGDQKFEFKLEIKE
jgi:hypothetical protein